jgi:DNA ligase-1
MKYSTLTEYYAKIEGSSKRLDKIDFIAELLKKTEKKELSYVVFLLQGRVFPQWDEQKIGVASRLVVKSINISTGLSQDAIEKEWKKTGDLGITTENVVGKKQQSTLFSNDLSVQKVFDNLVKLATLEGQGTVNNKIQLISELLTSAQPDEAKYIVRTILNDLRVGASQGTLRDGIIKAYFTELYEERDGERKEEYKETAALVQHAYDLTNDFSEVVETLETKGKEGLEELSLQVFRPVNPMLFPKALDIEDGFSVVGKPAVLEYKYDGFRVQVHKNNDRVELFTRRLENVSNQFPDIIDIVKKYVKEQQCILDCEVLGVEQETHKRLPFQHISQRIRRKYDIQEMAEKIPVVLTIFDMLMKGNESLLTTPFKKRRELLEKSINVQEDKIELSESFETDSVEKGNAFYEKSLLMGNEGIMMKSLEAGYKPGARIGYAVKVKPVLEPLDLAIVKAEWGHGKRAGWLTSFTIACKNEQGQFIEMGKVGTGVKELENDESVTFKQFTELLKPLVTKENNTTVEVKPEVIVEVDYEEIQKSTNYASGYALRFPRIKRIRTDLKEPSHSTDIERIYKEQRGRDQ